MIELDHVTKRYPDGTMAVDTFSLQIPAHETTVLVGPSGCGKTTVLRMVNRMVEPTSGVIRIDGQDVTERPAVQLRRSIGYVMQHGGLLPHQKVIDNVAAVLRLQRVPAAQARERAMEMIELVGLDSHLAQRYPAQLSGGQQQRVGVARALAPDPNILLMDEPFAAVDPIVRGELQEQVLHLQRELHKTIVFVTHDIDEALLLGDRIVILAGHGQIAQVGSPEDILTAPVSDFVRAFVGLAEGRRAMHARRTPEGTVLVDGTGRTRGILLEEP